MMAEREPVSIIELAANGASLRLVLLGRPYPQAEAWDRDVITAAVALVAPPFTASFTTNVWSHELAALRETILALHLSVGSPRECPFPLRDGTLTLFFRVSRRGAVAVEVTVTPDPASDPRLTFVIDADQTYLVGWAEQIGSALTAFPVQLPTRHP